MIFGDIDAGACPVSFTFGKDDKPFYLNGPNDTSAMQRRIVNPLERRCGPGGYDFRLIDGAMVSDPGMLRSPT